MEVLLGRSVTLTPAHFYLQGCSFQAEPLRSYKRLQLVGDGQTLLWDIY